MKRLKVDAVKVAHHGSKNNTDEELVSLIDSPRFLFSTSGAQFQHPDEEAIARIIDSAGGRPLTLYFNYLSDYNKKWKAKALQEKHNYSAIYNEQRFRPTRDYPRVIFKGGQACQRTSAPRRSNFIVSAVSRAACRRATNTSGLVATRRRRTKLRSALSRGISGAA